MDTTPPPLPGRFQDQNLVLRHFTDRIAVCCPTCQQRAEVATDLQTYHSTFRCNHCYAHFSKDLVWFDLSVKVYCNRCAHRIVVDMPNVKHKKLALKVKCPECGAVESYQPTYVRHVGYTFADGPQDPFLGLALWY